MADHLSGLPAMKAHLRIGQQLRGRVLDGRPYAVLDEARCARIADAVRPVLGANPGCAGACARWLSNCR